MSKRPLDRGFSTIVAGLAIAAGSVALFAVPNVVSGLHTFQLDHSAQEVASFLQQARTDSVQRDAPVVCRVHTEFGRTVLSLDWDLMGRQVHLQGSRLALPWGVGLLQDGQLQRSGTIAIFNPRGGFTFGAASTRSVARPEGLIAVSLKGPGNTGMVRDIAITGIGDFKVMGPADTRGHFSQAGGGL
jgi:hypothetical protein